MLVAHPWSDRATIIFSPRSHAGTALAVGAFLALLFVQVPAAATGPTTVAQLETALCPGIPGRATVTLQQNITEDLAVLTVDTVAGDCTATLDLNGHTLTVSGVVLGAGADLTIRDSSTSAGGKLIAEGKVHSEAGIRTTDATLRIESGTVSAIGGQGAAGIGGCRLCSGGTVRVSGGSVTATGGAQGAGIGGGRTRDGGTITVSGGAVTAAGGFEAAGIGGGTLGAGGTVTVSGGTVTANGGGNGAGIGGGASGSGGTIDVSGGMVTATSGFTPDWYGIGGGQFGTLGDVTIGDGLVRADTEPAAGQRRTTLTPVPVPVPVPAAVSVLVLSCVPSVPAVGGLVTCTVSGGGAGVEILWRAAYNPVFAEAGVTLGADGAGTFSFVVPRAALGEQLMVELVEWTAPVSVGVAGGPVPGAVPAGDGPSSPAGRVALLLVLVGLTVAVVVRRVVGMTA